ncbi:type I restriction-modification system subunit M/S [Streptomyces sp. Isolate_45]|uniref:N-6 DNA methylase n=1 Tax=Streptomyces sp. Isolate_45 TaxID=2950111 RepID=UPI0024820891|nr:type I restriction-modification system subunit M/S [Streptomyces sp. Isolate_45]MDA5283690.1 N-6 DNA methylase [Streptomyces sp. Isolate_45]
MESGSSTPFHTDDPQITRARIAELADVTRPTVTVWAHRFTDFPRPRKAAGKAYFLQSEVLNWLDDRRIPPHLRRPEERDDATYGRRARSTLAHVGTDAPRAHRPPASVAVPAASQGRPDRHSAKGRNRQAVRELMEVLADQVRGSGSMENYTHLLAALHFLRAGPDARWTEVRGQVKVKRTAAEALECIGFAVDEEVQRLGMLPRFAEALSDLVPRNAEVLERIMDLVAGLDGNAFQLIIEEYETHARLRSREFFTPQGVVWLMLGLARMSHGREPLTVYDPYVRGGEFLAAACVASEDSRRRHFGGHEPLKVFGQTTSAAVAPLAGINLALHGVRSGIRLSAREPWIEGPDLRGKVDIVLTNPPFNMNDSAGATCRTGTWDYGPPPLDNANFAYVQHALATLREGGRAAIVMPNKAGNSGSPTEAAIRKAMVRAGVVECVIRMPAKLFSGTAVPVSVWLLRHPGEPCEEVLFLEAGHLGTKKGPRSVLEGADARTILSTYKAHNGARLRLPVDDLEQLETVPSILVHRQVLLEGACSLNPLDHIPSADRRPDEQAGPQPSDDALKAALSDVKSLRESSAQADVRAADLYEEFAPFMKSDAGGPEVQLAELCEIKAGPSFSRLSKTDRSADGTVPVVFPRHLREGRITDTGEERVRYELAKRLGSYRLEPGDIVCVRAGKTVPPALVEASHADWLMSTNLIRIRVKQDAEVHPDYLVTWLRRTEVITWIEDRSAATAVPSISTAALGRMKVRLPSLLQQRRIAELTNALEDQALAHRALAAAVTRAHGLLVEEAMNRPSMSGALQTT